MQNVLLSSNIEGFFLGLFFTIVLFLFSILIVACGKMLKLWFQNKLQIKPITKQNKERKSNIKSIEINPDEFDKIVVKKG